MNDELTGAIRNALERGFSLDQAVQSLINAGYNSLEVNEAAKFFNQSAMSVSSSFTVVTAPSVEKPKQKSILSFSKPSQQQQVPPPKTIPQQPAIKQQVQQQIIQQPIQQPPQRPINIDKQIKQMYPQMASPIQAPVRNPEEVKKERKQTIAILLAILILILGIIMLILMFQDELLNLVT